MILCESNAVRERNMAKNEKIKNMLTMAISDKKEDDNDNSIKTEKKERHAPACLEIDKENYAPSFDFSEKNRKKRCDKENIEQWNNSDMAYYIAGLYYKKYSGSWEVSTLNLTVYMGNIKDALRKIVGFSDNIVLYDYFEYFFIGSSWSDFYKNRSNGKLFQSSLKEQKPIEAFSSQYDYNESLSNHRKNKCEKNAIEISYEALNRAYLLGTKNLVEDYGIILAVNWIIKEGKKSSKQAIMEVAKIVYQFALDDKFHSIKDITEKMGPYPKWFCSCDIEKVVCAINKKMGTNYNISVSFEDNKNKFEFLRQQ